MALRPGLRLIDRYEIRKVERSAPAYESARATQISTRQEVILWGVRQELLPGERYRAAFLADAQRARGFFHQFARPILDFGADPACCFVTLAPLEGESLTERITTGKSVRDKHLVRLALALGDALAAASSLGLVHGRLLPGDVRLAADGPKIAGIGLWAAIESGAAQAAYRQDIRYVAPEVRVGNAPTPRADVYSTAVMLGEIALGRFLTGTMVHDQLRERLRSARPALTRALGLALSQEPGARPGSVREFAAMLEQTLPADEGASGAVTEPRKVDGPKSAVPVGSVPASGGPATTPPRGKRGGGGDSRPSMNAPAASGRSASSKKGPLFVAAGEVQALQAAERDGGGSGKLILAVGALLLAGAGAGVVFALRAKKPPERNARADAAVVATRPDASPLKTPPPDPIPVGKVPVDPTTGCPRGMMRIDRVDPTCIDTYELPGKGLAPTVNVSMNDATAACAARGLRLCKMDEWTDACRGSGGLGFPYGAVFDKTRCNVKESGRGVIVPGGSMPDCVSKAGIFDMGGNVSEWVQGGYSMGGSAVDGQDGRCVRATRRSPETKAADLGVRCCQAALPAKPPKGK